MGETPKIDIGLSETDSYKRIIFTNKGPEIIDDLLIKINEKLI